MDKSLEESLLEAIKTEDLDSVSQILHKGANPNKTVGHGRTCLGEAASMGNIDILKLLVSASKSGNGCSMKTHHNGSRKRTIKCHKRKLKSDGNGETSVKCKNMNDRDYKDQRDKGVKMERNQGYYVFIHSDGSSSDESRIAGLISPLSPTSLTPSPQADLEWDEDIGNVAPTTSEDETWTSMYKWYAAILENTGAAIAAASFVTNGIDQQDACGRTALHYAAEKGPAAVKVLIEAGCKVDVTAGYGFTPLHEATLKNDIEVVRLLLAAGSDINYKTYDKMTPLLIAASRGYLDLVKVLTKNGCNLEARDSSERTALYLAAGCGHTEIVKHLVSCGANVNGEEIHGYTPLCEAVWQQYTSVVELLLSCGARITHSHRLIHNAIINRQEDIVRLLTNNGGINLHNDNGETPLLLSARLSQPNIAKILLQKGANVNSCNSITGSNALHVAVECIDQPVVFEEMLKVLLQYKIHLNATALTGDTALNRALLLHKDDAATLLIRYGADVNSCDLYSCGLDNLSIASRRKTHNLADMLIKAGHHRMPIESTAVDGSECVKWIYHASRHPLNLSDLCRIKLRRTCRNANLYKFVNDLPLPNSLKRFLMMEDDG